MPRQLKDAGARRRYNQPARGEWVDLQPLAEPVLPPYPIAWHRRTLREHAVPKYVWDAWREDPVTSQFSPADVAQALELGERYYRYKDGDRLRIMTYLGLNAKGRRELRWREPVETEGAARADERAAEVRRLKIVSETTNAPLAP